MSSNILKERPWDWYLRQALMGFHFDLGKSLRESGHDVEAQKALKKAWVNFSYLTGDSLNLKRNHWPIKGEIPTDATDTETKFFSRMLHKSDTKRTGGMKMFNIPCLVSGEKIPIQFYMVRGNREYESILDQFKWIKFYRGIDVPLDVQESLRKLYDISVENNVSFIDLCTYALKYPTNEKKSSNNNDQPSETKKEE